jgi:DNA-directed RNA polymerase subunit RPC12/RpoP
MARTNYKCPKCKMHNGVNKAYEDGNIEHCCKYCGCDVIVEIVGTLHWRPDWRCFARKGKL